MLASHLSGTLGFEAVHVNAAGLRGASNPEVLAYAMAEDRIVMTSNADDFRANDFRKLARLAAGHPAWPCCSMRSVANSRSRSGQNLRTLLMQ